MLCCFDHTLYCDGKVVLLFFAFSLHMFWENTRSLGFFLAPGVFVQQKAELPEDSLSGFLMRCSTCRGDYLGHLGWERKRGGLCGKGGRGWTRKAFPKGPESGRDLASPWKAGNLSAARVPGREAEYSLLARDCRAWRRDCWMDSVMGWRWQVTSHISAL